MPDTPTVSLRGSLLIKALTTRECLLQRTSVTIMNGTDIRKPLIDEIENRCNNSQHSTLCIRNSLASRESQSRCQGSLQFSTKINLDD